MSKETPEIVSKNANYAWGEEYQRLYGSYLEHLYDQLKRCNLIEDWPKYDKLTEYHIGLLRHLTIHRPT